MTNELDTEGLAIPIDFLTRRGQLRVKWLRCTASDFREPFFGQTIARRVSQAMAGHIVETAVGDLEVQRADDPLVRPTGYIFHVSRCGSTLLSNILKEAPRCVMLSEPTPILALLDWTGIDAIGSEALPLLRSTLISLMRPAHNERRSGFIKFFSQNIHRVSLIREAIPGVPEIFLYRDPLEVLVASLDWPSQDWIWRKEFTGLDFSSAVERPVAELFARGIGLSLRAMIDFQRDGTILMNYNEIDEGTPRRLARIYGLPVTESDLEAMRSPMTWVSKEGVKDRFFRSDTEKKRKSAGEYLQNLIAVFAADPYRELEALRARSQARPAG